MKSISVGRGDYAPGMYGFLLEYGMYPYTEILLMRTKYVTKISA